MKNISSKLILTIIFLITFKISSGSYIWTRMANYAGGERAFSFAFSIGSYGYVGCGNGDTTAGDFWQYDPSNNSWIQLAAYPGLGTYGLVGFSIGNYGYVGTGWSVPGGGANQYNDFWRYDPSNNTWSQMTSFPGSGRYGAVGFPIGDKGYVGLGYTPSMKDFWEYDPANNSWTQKTDFPGDARVAPIGIAIGNYGYVGTGYSANGNLNDFYRYDPVNNSWIVRASVPGLNRRNATGFSINNFGYVGLGYNDTTYHTDFAQYDPAQDVWNVVASIGGIPRYAATAFVVDNYGYVVGGSWAGLTTPLFVNDTWRFSDCDGSSVEIAPRPSNPTTPISLSVSFDRKRGLVLDYDLKENNSLQFNVYNSLGQLVVSSYLVSGLHSTAIPVVLSKDMYYYSVMDNEKRLNSGKVIVD